jgi:hypothetical protein
MIVSRRCLVVWLAATAAVQAHAQMISGDLIVKFRDTSEPGTQLAAVLAGQRSAASMAPLAARLSTELGVPLVLPQVTSGREALFAIDREALARALLARAGRESAIAGARMTVPPPSASVLPGAELTLRVELHSRTPAAAREAVPARLSLGPPAAPLLRPRVEPEDGGVALKLHYDIDGLTSALIAQLQQRPEVEYAQANRLLRPMQAPPARTQ